MLVKVKNDEIMHATKYLTDTHDNQTIRVRNK